jgi:hypothetical protein
MVMEIWLDSNNFYKELDKGNKKPLEVQGFWNIIVGAARFELATSWSQTRRDNRATLRPERFRSPGCKSKGSTAIKETN